MQQLFPDLGNRKSTERKLFCRTATYAEFQS